jgi:5-methylcytosine-specific restriction enzyme subunit McrC
MTLNAAKPHRLWCAYDALELDARIAGRFHHACRLLARQGVGGSGRRALSHALSLLSEAPLEAPSGPPVAFHRQNERFADIYAFAGQIIDQNAPDPRTGASRGYSLVYQIDQLFESFVAGFLRREVMGQRTELDGWELVTQGTGEKRFLVTQNGAGDAKGVMRLKPDLLFRNGERRVIADTKWYAIDPVPDARPSREVLYQMYAY